PTGPVKQVSKRPLPSLRASNQAYNSLKSHHFLFLKVTTFKAIVRGFDTYQFDQQNKISFYFSI
ncbi:hypothetical protein, partial [Ligilactobacillus salivarius]|uniref:hypothetical protein n=1 Tax=Ligilactobacillus salivarius TaxID=1624 RepID=UPI0019D61935